MATREEAAELAEGRDFEEGTHAGQGWAWGWAEEGSLREAERLSVQWGGDLASWALSCREGPDRPLGRQLAELLLGPMTRGEAAAFWRGALGREKDWVDEPGYAAGFLTGALRAWQAMRGRAG